MDTEAPSRPDPNSPPIYRRILPGLLLAAGLALLGLVLQRSGLDPGDLLRQVTSPLHLLLAALLTFLLQRWAYALRFRSLLHTMGLDMGWRLLMEVEYMTMFFAGVIPFKLFVPAKALLIRRLSQVPLDRGISICTLEFFVESVTVIAITLLSIPTVFRGLPYLSLGRVQLLVAAIAAAMAAFFLLPRSRLESLQRWAESLRPRPLRRAGEFAVRMVLAVRTGWGGSLRSPAMAGVAAGQALVVLVSVTIVELLFLSTGRWVDPLQVAAVLYTSVLIGSVTQIPSGLGVREASMVFLFTALGVPPAPAFFVTLAIRLLILLVMVPGYILSLRLGIRLVEEGANI